MHRGSEYFYVTFDGRVKLEADLTTDQRRIETAIGTTPLGGGTALYDAVLEGLDLSHRARQPQQAIVVISDGADQHSTHSLQEVIRSVREAELQIYTIGYFSREEETFFRRSGARVTLIDGRIVDNPQYVLQRLAKDSGGDRFSRDLTENWRKR
jgi:Mg-chelatase subunit ChlD